ncbi:hypothetical protein OEZ86_003152 [Tetradesmus obliquus]|nr:hypothetical protein OEZ86_003152 [Tetradesmus obliquus]
MLHLLLSCVRLAQRSDLVSAFLLSNCETGEIMSAVNREQHRSVVPHLNLKQQQLRNISSGIPVFKRLLQPVVQELKELQQEELGGGMSAAAAAAAAAAVAPDGNTSSQRHAAEIPAAAAAAGGGSANVDTAASSLAAAGQLAAAAAAADPDVAESFTHFKALGMQQRRARRLEILLQKEYLIRSYASTYVYGCLSWVQLATLSVLMTPFSPAPAMLVQEIFNAMEQQQQQAAQPVPEQQQQQQQAPAERRPRSRNRKRHAAAQQLHESGSLHSSEEALQEGWGRSDELWTLWPTCDQKQGRHFYDVTQEAVAGLLFLNTSCLGRL